MVHAEGWARALEGPCKARAIWPGRRLAAFAATIAHESAGGSLLHENLNYSSAGLMKTWPARFTQAEAEAIGRMPGKPADPAAIAEVVRDLYKNSQQPDQSYSERQIYRTALDRLARELAAVENIDEDSAAMKLEEMMNAA
jgi:hypothetical protein